MTDIINVPTVRPVSVLFSNEYSEKSSYRKSHLTFLICFGVSFGMRVFWNSIIFLSLHPYFFLSQSFMSLPECASGLTSSAVLQ